MEKKTLLVTGGVAGIVLSMLLVWRAVSLRSDAEQLAGGVYAAARGNYLIPSDEIYNLGVDAEQIPPLNQPEFTSVLDADTVLADELYGIAVEVDGKHRFYPVQVLNWHGVVNDGIGATRFAVTYDVLTGSAAVYESDAHSFAVSGKVYNNNSLLADEQGDLWYQIRGQKVVGDNAGTSLKSMPFQMYRWGDWKAEHPEGEVLGFDTGYVREYRRHPHGGYEATTQVYFPLNYVATPMPIKWVIDGIVINGEAAAFARKELASDRITETVVGGMPVVALYDESVEITRVFDATVNGQILTFLYDNEEGVFVDQETGTWWDATGYGVSGELESAQLTERTASEAYWFAWAAAYPNTTYPGIDTEDAPNAE